MPALKPWPAHKVYWEGTHPSRLHDQFVPSVNIHFLDTVSTNRAPGPWPCSTPNSEVQFLSTASKALHAGCQLLFQGGLQVLLMSTHLPSPSRPAPAFPIPFLPVSSQQWHLLRSTVRHPRNVHLPSLCPLHRMAPCSGLWSQSQSHLGFLTHQETKGRPFKAVSQAMRKTLRDSLTDLTIGRAGLGTW